MIMGITYTEEYETRKAVSEMGLAEGTFRIEYIAKGPIDGSPDDVSATVYRVDEEKDIRIGYGSYVKGASNIRFEAGGAGMESQASICARFYGDVQTIVS